MMNDLLSDMITRIRNGQNARLAVVRCQFSNLLSNVLSVLEREGFIRAFQRVEEMPGRPELHIELKYFEGEPVIRKIKRVSKPGRRQYSPIDTLVRVSNGLGISILSTSKGVMSDSEARDANVGGEVLCTVF